MSALKPASARESILVDPTESRLIPFPSLSPQSNHGHGHGPVSQGGWVLPPARGKMAPVALLGHCAREVAWPPAATSLACRSVPSPVLSLQSLAQSASCKPHIRLRRWHSLELGRTVLEVGQLGVRRPGGRRAAGHVFAVTEDEEGARPSRHRGRVCGAPPAASSRLPARGVKIVLVGAGEEQVRAAAGAGAVGREDSRPPACVRGLLPTERPARRWWRGR
jgi:hypothetical protein